MTTDYQKEAMARLPKERQDFVKKQLAVIKDGAFKGSMFMPVNGLCWSCGADLIEHELKNGNDGSELVTGCFKCHVSYCD